MNAVAYLTDDQHVANVWRWLIANGCTDVVVLGAPIEIRDGMIHYLAYQVFARCPGQAVDWLGRQFPVE